MSRISGRDEGATLDRPFRPVAHFAIVGALLGSLTAAQHTREAPTAPAPGPAADATANHAILTGRCVDARSSLPIVGARVYLSGSSSEPPWLHRERSSASWRNDPLTTDGDGRFRGRFTPPAGLWYTVGVLADGYVIATRRPTLALGGEADLGAIPLRRGGRIIGRVVDTTGAPLGRVSFRLKHFESDFRDDGQHFCKSRDDGSFATPCLFPGAWQIEVDGNPPLQSPLRFVIAADARDAEHDIVLAAVDTPVDARDKGNKPLPQTTPLVAVEVTVVEDATGRPVEEFDVTCASRDRLFPFEGRPGWSGVAWTLGRHPSGRARLEGVPPGDHLLILRAAGNRASLVQTARIRVPEDTPEVTFRVPIASERTLQLVSPTGTPLVDAVVELLLPLDDGPLSLAWSRTVEAFRDWAPYQGPHAVVLQSSRSDRDGRVVLRGSRHARLALRVLGPGHVPRLDSDIDLDGPPLRLAVATGGTLVGRVPVALRDGLRGVLPGRDDERVRRHRQSWSSSSNPSWPVARGCPSDREPEAFGLQFESPTLLAMPPEAAVDHPGGQPVAPDAQSVFQPTLPARGYLFPIDADGRFLVEGIEPGEWRVRLRVPAHHDDQVWITLGRLRIQDGQAHRLDLDPALLEPGILRGRLRLDGRPCTHRIVRFACIEPRVALVEPIACETDAHGRFAVRLLAGRWRPMILDATTRAEDPPADGATWIDFPGDAEVIAGATTDADFALTRR